VAHFIPPGPSGSLCRLVARSSPSFDLLAFPSPIALYLSPSVQVLSSHSTTSIEEVASIGPGVRFFQLYVRFSSCNKFILFHIVLRFMKMCVSVFLRASRCLQLYVRAFYFDALVTFSLVDFSCTCLSSFVLNTPSPALRLSS
jgi:hypothetical protein